MLQISFFLWYYIHPIHHGILIFHDISYIHIVLPILYNIMYFVIYVYIFTIDLFFIAVQMCRWGFPHIVMWLILFDMNPLKSIKMWCIFVCTLCELEEYVFYYCCVWYSLHVTLVKWLLNVHVFSIITVLCLAITSCQE